MKLVFLTPPDKTGSDLTCYLEKSGYEIQVVTDTGELKTEMSKTTYNCVVLSHSFFREQLISEIKQANPGIGVIVISSENSLENRIKALYNGADDYLSSDIEIAELAARIFSLLRRIHPEVSKLLTSRELKIDLEAKVAFVNDHALQLTRKEFELLVFFVRQKDRVIRKDRIEQHLSGDEITHTTKADIVYAHIKNLKRKISDAGCTAQLKTIYGVGYRWES